jgi:YNFM family putative membrane transporter
MSEPPSAFGLQALVFALVSAAFTTIYLLQPVLPILQQEFGVDEKQASLAISAVILGIALSNLPFGRLADRLPIRPIIAAGGGVVVFCGLACSMVQQLSHLVVLRFLQGLTIPALTTCLAAYLAKHLPADRLNVVMGSYVAATVAGGLGGRLLGGWIHPPCRGAMPLSPSRSWWPSPPSPPLSTCRPKSPGLLNPAAMTDSLHC